MRLWSRLIAVFVAAILFCTMLTGCASQQVSDPEPAIPDAFSCKADISYNGMQISAKVTRPSAAGCRIEVESPDTLKGMTLDWNGSTMNISYLGLSFDVDPASLPDTAFGNILIDVFNALARQNGLSIQNDKDSMTLSGNGESGKFSVVWDRKANALKSVEVPESGFSAQFSEFTSIQPETEQNTGSS